MTRRIVIGVAWWLATAYAFQFAAMIYGFPTWIGALSAIPIAVAIAVTRKSAVGRPADLRRIHQPAPDTLSGSPEPAALGKS